MITNLFYRLCPTLHLLWFQDVPGNLLCLRSLGFSTTFRSYRYYQPIFIKEKELRTYKNFFEMKKIIESAFH